MISRKRRVLVAISVTLAVLAVAIVLSPRLYRNHTTNDLASQLDEKCGTDGWAAVSVVSDGQPGEQINLYRTLYLKLLYPKCLSLTPYKSLQFTHKTGWANMPPHYAIIVYTPDGEYAYRWSMKENSWYISYQNSITILPVWEKEKILGTLTRIERVNGLNVPKEKEET
ncbi:MAG: hypothetical protein ACOCZS_02785 [Verrucomicrobiota bacterium]